MDLVLALSLEWYDTRLQWKPSEEMPIREIRVKSEDIWTPKIDLANRIYKHHWEIDLKATVGFNGKITILIKFLI